MSKEEIAALALEAGFSKYQIGGMFDVYLEKFAKLVAEREREARKAAQQETISLREELTKRAMQAEKDAYQRGVRDEREAMLEKIETGILFNKTSDEILDDLAETIRTHGGPCRFCNGTGERDSGASQPWGAPIMEQCECQSDGYVMVPMQPTRTMLDAAHVDLVRDGEIDAMLKGIWSSMIGSAQC